MSAQVQVFQRRDRQPRLGTPKWKDPERRQSIKDHSEVKMEWQLRTSLWTMTCWIALDPARPCLIDIMGQIEKLVFKRQYDIWDGEHTSPGCAWDPSMHGRSIKDAQPTIIFSSSSKICRRNAERIIREENIQVDPRGIGIEYYENGPEFIAGSFHSEAGCRSVAVSEGKSYPEKLVNSSAQDLPVYSRIHLSQAGSSNRTSKRTKPSINAALVHVGQSSCTMGGFLLVNDELFGLTVAHAFESEIEVMTRSQGETTEMPQLEIHHRTSREIGTLSRKRVPSKNSPSTFADLDWALCSIDRNKMRFSNSACLSDGSILFPRNVAREDPTDMAVVIHTGPTGIVNGFLIGDYSLVALPGSKCFQRMWIVILQRYVQKGDCGSWVLDPITGDWLGQIVAGKSDTAVAYIVLARDIMKDIADQTGVETLRMPSEVELEVAEMVHEVKRATPDAEASPIHQVFASSQLTATAKAANSAKNTSLRGITQEEPQNITGARAPGNRIRGHPTFTGATSLAQGSETTEFSAGTLNGNYQHGLSQLVTDRVEDHPDGWPRLAAFLNSEDRFGIFRRFGLLHCRILLELQIEITELENRLVALDRKDAEPGSSTGYRLRTAHYQPGWDAEQKELLELLREKLLAYGKCSPLKKLVNENELLLNDIRLQALTRPSKRNHRRVFNWIWAKKPVQRGQDDWIYHADDFVSRKKMSDWQSFQETWRDYRSHYRLGGRKNGVGEEINHYSFNLAWIRSVVALLTVVTLLIPVVLIFALPCSRTEMHLITLASVCLFTCGLSGSTGLDLMEILVGVAAYTAVLASLSANIKI